MSKLLAVKIIQTYTQLMKMQSETESQSSSSLSITVQFDALFHSVLKIVNCCWLVLLSVFPAFVH